MKVIKGIHRNYTPRSNNSGPLLIIEPRAAKSGRDHSDRHLENRRLLLAGLLAVVVLRILHAGVTGLLRRLQALAMVLTLHRAQRVFEIRAAALHLGLLHRAAFRHTLRSAFARAFPEVRVTRSAILLTGREGFRRFTWFGLVGPVGLLQAFVPRLDAAAFSLGIGGDELDSSHDGQSNEQTKKLPHDLLSQHDSCR